MRKSLKYTIVAFLLLMFLWWFSGGHIIPALRQRPSPAEIYFASLWQNFNSGLAFMLNLISR